MAEPRLAVEARGLRRVYAGAVALEQVTLAVEAGELFALLGPSGSGKTTFLRLVAGFERPDAGELLLWGERAAGAGAFVPPERRGVGMVFQDYALFPHMSVAENVAYGLPRTAERRIRVAEVLELAGLGALRSRAVHELSGGEQQRVALARALAPRPRVLLLDEPFSNLDATLRARMRGEVREIVKRAGATAILVTHDQEEAMSVADRIGFLWQGRIEQIGTPEEVYAHPASVHVAERIGDANVLRLRAEGGVVHTPFGPFAAPSSADRCAVVIRPEDVQLLPGGLEAEVLSREYYGHDQVLHVRLGDSTDLRVRIGPHERLAASGRIVLALRRDPVVLRDTPESAGGDEPL